MHIRKNVPGTCVSFDTSGQTLHNYTVVDLCVCGWVGGVVFGEVGVVLGILCGLDLFRNANDT